MAPIPLEAPVISAVPWVMITLLNSVGQTHARRDGQAGPQVIDLRLSGIEANANRHTLDDLGEIAGAGFERQQREGRAGARRKALDLALELAAERIDRDRRRL